MSPDTKVQGEQKADPVADATQVKPGEVANATLAQAPVDASALKQVTEQAKKLQSNLNGLKSASQRREQELRNQMEQREREWQDQLNRQKMAGMDEEQRKAYEIELMREQYNSMQQTVQRIQSEKSQIEGKQNAMAFFLRSRVPIESLEVDGTLEELVQSGYGYLASRNAELEAKLAEGATAPAPKNVPAPKLPNAPVVDTGQTEIPPTTTWADIDKEYANKGGREQFYAELTSGAISPDRLPLSKSKEE